MRIIECEQGTEEWLSARLGIPSASNFHRIVTTTGKWSAQADAYINELAAERITGERKDFFISDAMARGNELEELARDNFIFESDYEVDQVGFCIREDLDVGCSPDGLILEDMGLELKCPLAHNHVGYLRDNCLPSKYVQQVQGSLYVTDRDIWHFYSFHPDFGEQLHVVVHRDEEFIKLLDGHLQRAVEEIENCVERFKKRGEQNAK